nr:type II/IV secretion system ATPase subunit [Haloarchaeobius litoreus]
MGDDNVTEQSDDYSTDSEETVEVADEGTDTAIWGDGTETTAEPAGDADEAGAADVDGDSAIDAADATVAEAADEGDAERSLSNIFDEPDDELVVRPDGADDETADWEILDERLIEDLVVRPDDDEASAGDDDELTELVLWVEAQEPPEPEDIRETVLSEVKAHFDAAALDTEFAARPTDEFIDTHWFDFTYLDERVQVERYWVNKPYAYISVLFHPETKEFSYEVTEAVLDGFERYVREDLTRILRNSLMYHDIGDDVDREAVFESKAKEIIAEHAATVDDGSIYKLLYYLLRDFLDYGKIDPLMRDGNLEDISCDGVDVPVFVYHGGYRDLRTNVVFDQDRLNSFTVRLAQRAGKHISVSNPLVDASLPDGSRIQLTLGSDIATRGANFTIRKFADVPYTPVDLIKWNTFDVDQMAYFWLVIENNRSLVFAGGTGSGKTTSMNAVGFFIPPNAKVVSIEDTREITLPHDNWIQSVSRPPVTDGGRGEVSMYQLLQASLRQRPEYLLVGEIRTEQRVALTFFNAIATGHTSYTTIHADSVDGALARLQNAPLSVPVQMIQDLDVIAIQKQIFDDDTRVRRNSVVAEIRPSDDLSQVEANDVFRWDPSDDEYDSVGDSELLAEIAEERGWTADELADELAVRAETLQYLVDEDITDYDTVTETIHRFDRDRDSVLAQVRAAELSAPVEAEAR